MKTAPGTKWCPKCEAPVPLTGFTPRPVTALHPDGVAEICTPCMRELILAGQEKGRKIREQLAGKESSQ